MNLNDLLDKQILNNTVLEWLIALLILLVTYLLLQFIKHFIARRMSKWAKKTITDVDDFVADLLAQTKSFLVFIFSLYFASLRLTLGNTIKQGIQLVAIFALLIQFGLWLTALVSFWVRRQARKEDLPGTQATTLSIVGLLVKIAIWFLLLLIALDNIPGVQITTLIASLGVGGIAVGLAVQSILKDIFASLSIALDKPFVIGDAIAVGDIVGTIEHIGLKSVRLRSLSGEQIVFSTSDLLSSRIKNYQKMSRRMVVMKFGVSYNTPQKKIEQIPTMMEEIIAGVEHATFARSHLTGFGASTLDFETVYHIEVPDYMVFMDSRQKVALQVLKRFEDENIEMPYPTQTVLVDRLPPTD
jgi:small-conductance mechanosensitive channel